MRGFLFRVGIDSSDDGRLNGPIKEANGRFTYAARGRLALVDLICRTNAKAGFGEEQADTPKSHRRGVAYVSEVQHEPGGAKPLSCIGSSLNKA